MIELKAPFMVDFEITNRCPYKCSFCEANLSRKSIAKELSTNDCLYTLEKLSESGVFAIFLTGGEPTARTDLPDLIKHCFDIGLEPTVSTNGFYLNDAFVERIANSGLNHIQVSIHGQGNIHDSVVGIPGSYTIVLNNLRKLVECCFRVEVACVGLKENLESIPSLLRDLASIGIKKFRILRYLCSHEKEMLKHIPSKEMIIDTMPKIIDISKMYNVDLLSSFCPGLSTDPRHIYEGIHPMALTCPAGKTEFAILPNGDVYPCVNLKDSTTMYCGNILSDEVEILWNHPTMTQLRKLTPDDYTGECRKCEKKYVCYSARCVALNLTDNLYGDDISCYAICNIRLQ